MSLEQRDCHLSVDAGAHHVSSNGVVANQVVAKHSLAVVDSSAAKTASLSPHKLSIMSS